MSFFSTENLTPEQQKICLFTEAGFMCRAPAVMRVHAHFVPATSIDLCKHHVLKCASSAQGLAGAMYSTDKEPNPWLRDLKRGPVLPSPNT